MFGLQYELKCPYCGKTFIADHGITSYYKIKGYGDEEYIVEHCRHCNKKYFRLCYSKDVMNMKNSGLTYEEALIKLEEKQNHANHFCFGNNVIPEEHLKFQKESRIRRCNQVYFTKDEELYIDVENINEDDLTQTSVVCW